MGDRGIGMGGKEGRTLAVARQDGDRDSPEIEAVIGARKGGREREGWGWEDAGQGFATPWVTPYDLKIQPQRRDETRIRKGLKGGWHQLAAVPWRRRREDEMTRVGMHSTATVRNGDIDQRNAFRHLGLTGVTFHSGALEPSMLSRADAAP